jgi:hypothetical protein
MALCRVLPNSAFTGKALGSAVTVHVLVVPAQPPLQLAKASWPVAAAVRVTELPVLKDAVHVPGQLIPAGVLTTVPEPAPDNDT